MIISIFNLKCCPEHIHSVYPSSDSFYKTDVHSEHCQSYKVKNVAKIVHGKDPSTIFCITLDVWQGYE